MADQTMKKASLKKNVINSKNEYIETLVNSLYYSLSSPAAYVGKNRLIDNRQ